MLTLQNITKKYQNNKILDNINLTFRQHEFVCILGASGSGKSTFLNILGGMDEQFEGNLYYGKDKITNWNSYRNHEIGFIFQDFYLFLNDTVLENVKIGLELRHLKEKEITKKCIEALKKVGLEDQINQKASVLSGGQRQRIALARALVLEPKILLADEVTASLDNKTGNQIMKILEEYAKSHLVIFVTHNESLAYQYGTRIIKIDAGKIKYDSKPYYDINIDSLEIHNVSLPLKTILNFSFKRFSLKKKRHIFLASISSIGLIGILLVFALSNCFETLLSLTEKESISKFAITISSNVTVKTKSNGMIKKTVTKEQNFDEKAFLNEKIKPYTSYILNQQSLFLPFYKTNNQKIKVAIDVPYYTVENRTFLEQTFWQNFSFIEGGYPKKEDEIVLVIPSNYEVTDQIINAFYEDKTEVSPESFLNKVLTIYFIDPVNNSSTVYKNLKIVGIIQNDNITQSGYFIFSQNITNNYIEKLKKSSYYQTQLTSNYNLITKDVWQDNTEKQKYLNYLIGNDKTIYIYPKDKMSKDKIIKELENYKETKELHYTDQFNEIFGLLNILLTGIKAFFLLISIICFLLTSILIGFIASTSFLERKKEVGILRSLGAKSKDTRKLFYSEMGYLGITSFLFTIFFTTIIFNVLEPVLSNFLEFKISLFISKKELFVALLWSILFPIVGSVIPIRKKSKKTIIKSLIEE